MTTPTKAELAAMQRAMLTVPGVTLPRFGADGDYGPEFRAAFALVIAKAGGQSIASTGTLPDGYLAMLAKIESGNRPYVKAATSSASGLYQFIKSTWRAEGGEWGNESADLAFGGLRPTVQEQDQRATSFTLKNARDLAGAGIPINKATLYAAHFLGVTGAIRILRAAITTPLSEVTEPAQRTANPTILGKGVVGDFFQWLERKTGDRPRPY